MLMRSFDHLDKRGLEDLRRREKNAAESVAKELEENEGAIQKRLKEAGNWRLQTLQLRPDWPKTLEVEVDDAAWATVLAGYGERELVECLEDIRDRYVAEGRKAPMKVRFAVVKDGRGMGIDPRRPPEVLVTLPTPEPGKSNGWFLRGLGPTVLGTAKK